MPPPLILCLESTCDETAAAVIDGDLRVLSSVVASQEQLHARYGGVVPEIASRAHVERILPVIDEAVTRAGVALADLDAIAVANRPGLAGSLLVGLMAAKALCLALDKPLIAVNHLAGHIYAGRVAAGRDIFPCLGLVVSGGHTSLYRCDTALEQRFLGGTIDDAAGESFDKVASLLGLPYPGGPQLERVARGGNPRQYAFPRSFIREPERRQFSFSGLKTAVRYALAPQGTELPPPPFPARLTADIAASFQQAVIDCLVIKAIQTARQERLSTICLAGGVAANQELQRQLRAACNDEKLELIVPPRELCTDNAVLGAIAIERYRGGLFEKLDLEIFPGLER
ncbi:MAG: tRNA (adenosine(37)-N6)-threonylcarbamoyltransferase complex transferase subunit TsaD [Pirellulales bacterium]|nr:tRNA (adenosine(37)-N6)-threonylcarbamoyltransferase complex transferase subunit TsaD [Pirellulales bacterium]